VSGTSIGGSVTDAAFADRAFALCVVGPLPPPSGGMANQCEQLVALLRKEGVAVDLVRNNPDYRPAWVGHVPVLRAAFRLLPYLLDLWRTIGRADVVHVLANSGLAWHLFAAPAVWVGRARRVPVVLNYRGGNADRFFAGASRLVLVTLRMAGARVTPSGFLQRVFTRYGLDAIVVPNTVDLSRFMPVPMREFDDAPHLVVTRNLEAIYDIPTAIRAFAAIRRALPNARLTIAGTGPERERLERLVAELGQEQAVRFTGGIGNADMPAMYAAADCMLNPSTIDNMPVSILEAFASGVPVVSTDAGGIPDMVEDGVSALLVPVGDDARMAGQAIRVLTESALRNTLRAAGLQAAARYAWPRVRDQWLALYRELASGESGIR
jgi:glycosyltransferase involved in cell wall biosynthesis